MKIGKYTFKVGADPEFFVKKFDKLVSAYGLVSGTKDAPLPVKWGAVQVDGMALEFNITPATTAFQFERNMSTVLQQITDMVPGYEIFVEPVADFGADYIAEQPEAARDLGCNPDYNAYTKLTNPRPDPMMPFRTASGHIHIGWHDEPVDINDPGHLEACYTLTKALDLFVGAPSLAWDNDDRRRMLYGRAGSFRPKSYGLEYRVLSNKWIVDPLLRRFVYHNTLCAVKACFHSPDVGELSFSGLTAKDILDKKEGWEYSLNTLRASGVIKTIGYYA